MAGTNERGASMKIYHEVFQGSEDWDRLRAVRPTASEFGKIFTGTGRISEQRESYMRRLAIAIKYPVPQFVGNEWTERGHALEPDARRRVANETGWDIREVGFVEKDDSIAGGSPDFLIYDTNGHPVAGGEIKCFKLDKHLSIVNAGVLPTANKPQVHGSLWITGLAAWVFVCYCPDAFPLDFWMIEVTPDDYTIRLGEAVDEFVAEYELKWQTLLAEYEIDKIGAKIETLAPTVSRLVRPKPIKEIA